MYSFTFLLLLVLPASLFAQTPVKGKVTDADGNPLQSVSVSVQGKTGGVTTAADGTFSLAADRTAGDTLVFSYVGFADKKVKAGLTGDVNVVLEKNDQSLNNVVVVGYGTQRRKDITGSVVSIDKQRLENMPNSNFAQALEGAVPGVSVNTNGGGAEGNSLKILIRGQKSITANTDPIIVMDGIPYNGSITDIVPTDIASVDILKDASATAIYGSRGANGVILVTTKRGVNGKPVLSYDGFTGFQDLSNLPPVLMGEDFYRFKVKREPNSVTASEQAHYDAKDFTNWLDLATRTGMRTQHNIGLRGGSGNFKYFVSAGYLDVKGVAINDNFKRFSTRFNLEANMKSWLTFGTNTQLSYDDRKDLAPTFSGDYGVYTFNPLTTPYDADGNLTIYPWPEDKFFANPLAPTLASSADDTYKIFNSNYLLVKVPFVKGLSYRLNAGTELQVRSIDSYYGRNTRTGAQSNGSLSRSNSTIRNYTLENVITYDRSFNKHTISFTGLYGYEYRNAVSNGLNAQGFPNDVLTYHQANVALALQPTAGFTKETLISQMARINYSYNSKYLLSLTGRRDGFSGFGANNKFAFFPVAAIGWNITSEPFFPDTRFINQLKLRVSYGSNGNSAVSPYQTLARLSTRTYVEGVTTAPGYVPTTLANPSLKWETSTQANFALDFAVLNNRVQGTVEFYKTKTKDLLLQRNISTVQGINTVLQNIGATNNQGFELGLTTANIQEKDFSWTSNANLSVNRNKIIDLYGDGKNDTASSWFIGHPIDSRLGYVFDGVWQLKDDTAHTPQGLVHPGYAKVRDLNGDGVINAKDRTIIDKMQPDFTWGFANTFKYKNITLYIFAQGVYGTRAVNSMLSDNNVNAGVRYTTVVKNWWTPDNPTNDFYANVLNATGGLTVPIVENSSFVRVKDISLSYDFSPAILEKLKLSKLRVYVEARNPFTFTKWSGLDPEFTSQNSIPLQKEYLVGLNVSF
jgi:TonB-linked SusC/RagA family outer membrane protein